MVCPHGGHLFLKAGFSFCHGRPLLDGDQVRPAHLARQKKEGSNCTVTPSSGDYSLRPDPPSTLRDCRKDVTSGSFSAQPFRCLSGFRQRDVTPRTILSSMTYPSQLDLLDVCVSSQECAVRVRHTPAMSWVVVAKVTTGRVAVPGCNGAGLHVGCHGSPYSKRGHGHQLLLGGIFLLFLHDPCPKRARDGPTNYELPRKNAPLPTSLS